MSLTKIALRHEQEWCPVTCTQEELNDEILTIKKIIRSYDKSSTRLVRLNARKHFLEGVAHARMIIKAATGGKVG